MQQKLARWAYAAALCLCVGSVGCGEGTNSGGDPSPVADGSTALSELVGGVPILGQLLSDCLEDGTAVLIQFVETDVLSPITMNTPLEELLDLEDLLVDPEGALTLPIVGGLLAGETISGADALALLPGGSLPLDTPILGLAPITCSDGLVPVDLSLLGNFNSTLGAIPILGPVLEDGSVEIVGAVLGVAGSVLATEPLPPGSNPLPISLRSFDVLNGNLGGLDALGALVQSLLDVLTLNL